MNGSGYADRIKPIPNVDRLRGQKGVELSKTPVELKSGDWSLKVVPWIGGRIISMVHLPSGNIHTRDLSLPSFSLQQSK